MRRKKPFWLRFRDALLVVVLFPLVLPMVILAILCVVFFLSYRAALYLLVWILWLPKGKDVLFVYSDSTIWRDYLLAEVLPKLAGRALVLNYSERRTWSPWSFPVRLFRSFGGPRSFCPLIILFRPFNMAKIYRFWGPFEDWKHGYKEPVERLTQDLFAAL